MIDELVSQMFECFCSRLDEQLVLLDRVMFCEEVVLYQVVDTVREPEIIHLELYLALPAFALYYAHLSANYTCETAFRGTRPQNV